MQSDEPCLRPVINATGSLLHPRLGRAPLAEEAILEIAAVGRDYSSLELDLATGEPLSRTTAVAGLLQELTGAEAALVVGNQAGAALLTLAALAGGRQVIVSRGDLFETTDHFRLAEVAAAAGASLCEVGATNRTRLEDYRQAVVPQSALLWRGDSGSQTVPAAEAVELTELVRLGQELRLPVICQLEFGAILDPTEFGLGKQATVAGCVRANADITLFAGDGLLGGPACGIAVGRRQSIEQLSRHPLARVLRADKLTLAALAATLRLYRTPDIARREIPLLSLLSTSLENLRNRAQRLAPQLAALEAIETAEAVPSQACLEEATLPVQQIPTWCVVLKPAKESTSHLARRLQTGAPAIVGRIEQDRLWLDLRTVVPRQDQLLIEAVAALEPTDSSLSTTSAQPSA